MNSLATQNREEGIPLTVDGGKDRDWVAKTRDAMKEALYWEVEPKAENFRLQFYKFADTRGVPIGPEGYEKIGELARKLGGLQWRAECDLLTYLKAAERARAAKKLAETSESAKETEVELEGSLSEMYDSKGLGEDDKVKKRMSGEFLWGERCGACTS